MHGLLEESMTIARCLLCCVVLLFSKIIKNVKKSLVARLRVLKTQRKFKKQLTKIIDHLVWVRKAH